ncbi:MAG: 23S rRNA (uracil(1939)-C(5))-methyltransferase RlmD [Spirosomataceae bacterium]
MSESRKKNQPFILENCKIEDFAAEGKCIVRKEGEVIFVEGNIAPGDIADIRIYKRKKNFSEASVVAIKEHSRLRVTPVCEHFGTCGGCKWQHLSYESQLRFKTQQVMDALTRIAKVQLPEMNPIIGSPATFYYRNKLEYTFSKHRWLTHEEIASGLDFDRNVLGFHIPKRFDKILDIKHCHLQADPSNALRLATRAFVAPKDWEHYDHVKQEGFLRNQVIRTTSTGELMVIMIFARPEMSKIQETMQFLVEQFPEITSLYFILNEKMNDSYADLEPILFAGKPYIEEQMEGLKFRIGPKSFYQTNSTQAYELYKVARSFAQLTGHEHVYDLYTGTGTIANFVAKQAKHVVGIEYVEDAIQDAKINSQINGISNTSFFAGDMRRILLPSFIEQNGTPDVVITDPPRAGMDKEVVEVLMQVAPQRIVYVSCNPATQARDLSLMDALYEVRDVQPVDMFPHTHHVENVVCLEKRDGV